MSVLLRPGGLGRRGRHLIAILCATLLVPGNALVSALEAQQPEVQWSPAGSTDWRSVVAQQTVCAGDRVRSGRGATARLVYADRAVTTLAAESGLLIQRVERFPDGSLVVGLFQSLVQDQATCSGITE